MKGIAPDFIGIGAMKAATYWFYCCLEAHPDVCMGSRKEVHFFDVPQNYDKGVDWYESHFTHCEAGLKRGEITPGYICIPGTAKLIHDYHPDVKLFACLRNPIERAYSHYRFNVVRKGGMSIYKSFEEALQKEAILTEWGLYAKQLQEYYDYFPKDNLLVVLYDDIRESPEEVLRELYSFVGVDDEFLPEVTRAKKGVTGEKVAEYRVPYVNPMLYWLRDRLRDTRIKQFFGAIGVNRKLQDFTASNRRMVVAKHGVKPEFPPLDAVARERMVHVFREDVARLEKMIGRDLSRWLTT